MADLSGKIPRSDKDRHFKHFTDIPYEIPFTCHACGRDVYGQKKVITAIMLNRVVSLCNQCGPVIAKFNKTVRIK